MTADDTMTLSVGPPGVGKTYTVGMFVDLDVT